MIDLIRSCFHFLSQANIFNKSMDLPKRIEVRSIFHLSIYLPSFLFSSFSFHFPHKSLFLPSSSLSLPLLLFLSCHIFILTFITVSFPFFFLLISILSFQYSSFPPLSISRLTSFSFSFMYLICLCMSFSRSILLTSYIIAFSKNFGQRKNKPRNLLPRFLVFKPAILSFHICQLTQTCFE